MRRLVTTSALFTLSLFALVSAVRADETPAVATPTSAQSAATLPQVQGQSSSPHRWKLALQIDNNTSLHHFGDSNQSAGTDLWIWPHYAISRLYDLSVLSVIGKEWTGERKTVIRASDIIVRRNATKLTSFLNFTPAITLTPPLSTDRASRESLILATKIAPRLAFDLSPLNLSRISGFFDLSLGRQFHKYYTSSTGKMNNQYSMSLWAVVGYEISQQWAFSLSGSRTSAWNYFGTITNSFKLSEELSFQLNDKLTFLFSHENGGPLLGPNGHESNFAITDPENSTFAASIAISL